MKTQGVEKWCEQNNWTEPRELPEGEEAQKLLQNYASTLDSYTY